MERRVFLKRGLFGGALLAAGGVTLGLSPTKLAYKPARALRVLGERHFAVMASIATRVVRGEDVDPVAIAHGVDEVLSIAVLEAQEDVKSLLLLFDNALAGLVFDGRFRPFTTLAPEEQDRVLYAWRDSRLVVRRGGYNALRKLTLAAYYGSSATWAGIGYPGPPEIATE